MGEERIYDMAKEEWRDVVGYEGYYQVSNLGRIKVLPHKVVRGFCTVVCPEKVLKPRQKDNKYLFVKLSNGSKKTAKEKYIHRLVAIAFLPNPNSKEQVDHIDGDKTNNAVSNLRWATCIENVRNPNTIGKGRIKVRVSSRDGKYSECFESLTSASKKLNIPLPTLSWVRSQQRKGISNYRYIIEEA